MNSFTFSSIRVRLFLHLVDSDSLECYLILISSVARSITIGLSQFEKVTIVAVSRFLNFKPIMHALCLDKKNDFEILKKETYLYSFACERNL